MKKFTVIIFQIQKQETSLHILRINLLTPAARRAPRHTRKFVGVARASFRHSGCGWDREPTRDVSLDGTTALGATTTTTRFEGRSLDARA